MTNTINTSEYYSTSSAAGACFLIILMILSVYCYKDHKRKAILKAKTIGIKNPMVTVIGIAFYDSEISMIKMIDKEIEAHFPDLEGIQVDVPRAIEFFGFNRSDSLKYDIYPKQYLNNDTDNVKLFWTEKELMKFLRKQADKLKENLKQYDESNNKRYDGLLFILNCHGIEGNYIVTSDYKAIDRTASYIFKYSGDPEINR